MNYTVELSDPTVALLEASGLEKEEIEAQLAVLADAHMVKRARKIIAANRTEATETELLAIKTKIKADKAAREAEQEAE